MKLQLPSLSAPSANLPHTLVNDAILKENKLSCSAGDIFKNHLATDEENSRLVPKNRNINESCTKSIYFLSANPP